MKSLVKGHLRMRFSEIISRSKADLLITLLHTITHYSWDPRHLILGLYGVQSFQNIKQACLIAEGHLAFVDGSHRIENMDGSVSCPLLILATVQRCFDRIDGINGRIHLSKLAYTLTRCRMFTTFLKRRPE